jgi:hypothetical protein
MLKSVLLFRYIKYRVDLLSAENLDSQVLIIEYSLIYAMESFIIIPLTPLESIGPLSGNYPSGGLIYTFIWREHQ